MGNSKPKPDLQDVAIELKMTARQMEKQSQKVEQMEKAERKKIVDVLIIIYLWILLGFKQRTNGQRQDIRRKRNSEPKRSIEFEAVLSENGGSFL